MPASFGVRAVLTLALLMAAAAIPAAGQTFVPNWVQQAPATSPPGRYAAGLAFDAAHGGVVLFGGSVGSAIGNDTWVWDGSNWTQQSPATSPSSRMYFSMVYDAARQQTVLFGGLDSSFNNLNDTWVWDGVNWTQKSPAASPSARQNSAMAYDPVHQQVVLFGGSKNDHFNDTWVWNGNNWTQLSPASSPSARALSTMTFDAASGRIVLFGGTDGVSDLNDTWEWDGTNWTQRSPATNPPVREGGAMAYDAAHGSVVLIGGNAGVYRNDTWVWDGTNWTQQSPVNSPPGAFALSMAYDAASGQMILFGGTNPSGSLGQTWTLGQGNFGSVAVGSTSAAQTFNFSIPAGTTVGSIGVLTQGAPNIDFTDAGGSTCLSSHYVTDTPCKVNVKFDPNAPGLRSGAIVFRDGVGNVLSTTKVWGMGTGPQIAFQPAAITSIDDGTSYPTGVAVDGSGNVYLADFFSGSGTVKQVPPGCTSLGCMTPLGGSFYSPTQIAVDGAGNVYVADATSTIKVIPPGCTSSGCVSTLGGGFTFTGGVAVDGPGNVYVADFASSRVSVMPPGCASAVCVTSLGGGFNEPIAVALDGSGNVYVADAANHALKEIPPGCVSPACVIPLGGSFNFPAAVAVDAAGNVYIADQGSNVVSMMPPGCTTSACVVPLGSGFNFPSGIGLDASGNIFVGDFLSHKVKELTAATALGLTFASPTLVGTTDTLDGTQTAQVFSIGNQPLVFSGLTYPTNFSQGSSLNPCTNSTSLSPGEECDVPVVFDPTDSGAISENVTLTDNNLNTTNAQQFIPLSGAALAPAPSLAVVKSHTDTFTQGSTATWTIVVSNTVSSSTTGTNSITVVDPLPAGFTLASYASTGSAWSCGGSTTVTCTSTTAIAGGSSSTINLTVNIASNSPTSVSNTASAWGGGDTAHTSSGTAVTSTDSVTVVQTPATITINGGGTQSAQTSTAFGAALAVTVKDAAGVVIPNYPITFTAPSSGASGTFSNSSNSITLNTNGSGVASAGIFTANATAGGPYSVVVTAGSAPSVSFSLTNTASTVNVTIGTNPTGLSFSVAGTPYTSTQSLSLTNATQYAVATTSPQAGTAGMRYVFSAWSDGGAISHNITASAGATFTASFNKQYQLNVTKGTGGASVTPTSGSYYASGTPVAITATAASGYHFVNWTGSADIASSTSVSTTVTMNAAENITANFATNSGPIATVSPTSIDFGTVYLASTVTKTITVKNTGTSVMTIRDPLLAIVRGGNSNEFVTVNLCPVLLPAGKSCTMTVTFIAGPYYTPQTATLNINGNAPGSPQQIPLTATVINSLVLLTPASLSYGNQTVNQSVTKSVTLRNIGSTPLQNIVLSITGRNPAQFTLALGTTCGTSLAANSSCTINVAFKPVAKVSYSATLQVSDNARTGTQTVSLTGTGH